MADSLIGDDASIAELRSTNRTHQGRPVFEAWTKLGANLAGIGGGLDLQIRRVNADGGAATLIVPANVITPAPLSMANPFITMPENPLPGSVLGQLSATGGVGTKVYGLGAGHNGALAVSPTGLVSVAANVLGALAVPAVWNFETGNSFTAPIQVSDNTGTATATLTIILTNANEAPSGSNITVNIQSAQTGANAVIVALSQVSDPDVGNTHTQEIVAGNNSGYFAITGGNLISTQLVPASTIHSLTIRILDAGGLMGFYTITITIADLVPNSITLSPSTLNFTTTTAVNTVLSTATTTAAAGGTWSLSGSYAFLLSISSAGVITRNSTIATESATNGTFSAVYTVGPTPISQSGLVNITLPAPTLAQSIVLNSSATTSLGGTFQVIPAAMLTATGGVASEIIYTLVSTSNVEFANSGAGNVLPTGGAWSQSLINLNQVRARLVSDTALGSAVVTITSPNRQPLTATLNIGVIPSIVARTLADITHTVLTTELRAVGVMMGAANLTYTVSYPSGTGRFKVGGSVVTTFTQQTINNGLLIWESGTATGVAIFVTDSNGGASPSTTVLFNPAPSFTLDVNSATREETTDSENAQTMATITATDTTTATFSLSGPDAALFELTESNTVLTLKANQAFAFADGDTRTVVVEMDDAVTGTGVDVSETFTLNVTEGPGGGYGGGGY